MLKRKNKSILIKTKLKFNGDIYMLKLNRFTVGTSFLYTIIVYKNNVIIENRTKESFNSASKKYLEFLNIYIDKEHYRKF